MRKLGCSMVALALAAAIAGCGETDDKRRAVERQVAARFGPSATAMCAAGDFDETWSCDVFVEDEQRYHDGCRVTLNRKGRIVAVTPC